MKLAFPLTIVLLCAAPGASAAVGEAPEPAMQAAALTNSLQELIKESAEEADAFGGYVVKGRVVVADPRRDPRMVQTQALILMDGRFATTVADRNEPLRFRMIGFEPVDLDLTKFAPSSSPRIPVDLGDIRLEGLDPRHAATLTGRAVLSDGGDHSIIRVEAFIAAHPFNSPGGGSVPRSPVFWDKRRIRVRADGAFTAGGLTPSNYTLTFKAKGYAGTIRSVTVTPGKSSFPETIVLEPVYPVRLEYAVSDGPRFKGRPIRKAAVLTGERWASEPQVGEDFVLSREGKDIYLEEAGRPSFIADLGTGRIEDHLDVEDREIFRSLEDQGVRLRSGHVYALEHRLLRHWVLFRVEFDEPPAAGRLSGSKRP